MKFERILHQLKTILPKIMSEKCPPDINVGWYSQDFAHYRLLLRPL